MRAVPQFIPEIFISLEFGTLCGVPRFSSCPCIDFLFFFFNDTATTEIYTLSLHDALPICARRGHAAVPPGQCRHAAAAGPGDRKSTRLNSSHLVISYAVFCLKKKKTQPLHSTLITTYFTIWFTPNTLILTLILTSLITYSC